MTTCTHLLRITGVVLLLWGAGGIERERELRSVTTNNDEDHVARGLLPIIWSDLGTALKPVGESTDQKGG